jgi:hypothetical protein
MTLIGSGGGLSTGAQSRITSVTGLHHDPVPRMAINRWELVGHGVYHLMSPSIIPGSEEQLNKNAMHHTTQSTMNSILMRTKVPTTRLDVTNCHRPRQALQEQDTVLLACYQTEQVSTCHTIGQFLH